MARPTSSRTKAATYYTENDLRRRCIRLFDLDITCTGDDGSIHGELRVVSLDDRPIYDALSYAWGSPFPPYQITCSGNNLPITKNCYDALRSLIRNSKIRTIWIDAVCINQSDSSEKNHQVPLMPDIYGGAKRVYICLGNGTKDSDDALEWIVDVTPQQDTWIRFKVRSLWSKQSFGWAVQLITEKAKIAKNRLMPRKTAIPYRASAMQDLVRRDWFKRMWTLQELVMSNDPTVVCGNKFVRWSKLYYGIYAAVQKNLLESKYDSDLSDVHACAQAALQLWNIHLQKTMFCDDRQVPKWLSSDTIGHDAWQRLLDFLESYSFILVRVQVTLFIAIALFRFLRGVRPFDSWVLAFVLLSTIALVAIAASPGPFPVTYLETQIRRELIGLLDVIRIRQAELPVDKVFALYGVFKELGIRLEPPDYTKSTAEVYLNFTHELIKWHRSLRVLTEVSYPGIPGIPTWVPDWSKRHYRVFNGRARAAGNSSPSFSILPSGRSDDHESDDVANHSQRIITAGAIVDKVTFYTTALQRQDESHQEEGAASDDISPIFLDNIRTLRQWFLDAQHPRFHTNHSDEAILDTLFEIMHSETNYQGEHQAKLRQYFTNWKSYITTDSSTATTIDSAELVCARALMSDEPIYWYHVDRCNALAGKRAFFTTAEGRLGTGPVSVHTGDVVALLAGLSCPLLLRVKGPNCEVVGVAYVDRIMQGEAWPETEADIQLLTLV